ncbi:MAG: glycosyltransferase family 4 protein [Patescibacteria group bacterium]
MKIGMLGPIWHNIPPKGYGGTELVVYNLVNCLSKNNEVYLFGPKTAKVKANLIPTIDKPLMEMDLGNAWENKKYTLSHIKKAFDMVDEFDILHIHLNRFQDYYALELASKSKTPVLFTPHFLLPDDELYPDRAEILTKYSFLPFSSISDSQRKGSNLNFVGTVYNGIDLTLYKFNPNPSDYFVWIGKIIAEKGTKEAILGAKKANKKLYLVGPYDKSNPLSVGYFENEVKPLIDRKSIIWLGEVSLEEKVKVLGGARAFISPLQWDEPFGLVMIEAQALGTPIISFKRGDAHELIQDGKSGYLVENIDQMVEKMNKIGTIDRKETRKQAEKFSQENMASGYEKIYRQVIRDWNIYLKNSKI